MDLLCSTVFIECMHAPDHSKKDELLDAFHSFTWRNRIYNTSGFCAVKGLMSD